MPAAKEIQWTPEEDAIIRDFVKKGLQTKYVLPLLPKRNIKGVYDRMYHLGIKSGTPALKYSKNEAFWEIPNSINSYYAGLAAADMSISADNRHTLSWQCHSNDELYMLQFLKECDYTGTIFHSIVKSPHSNNTSIHSQLRINACQKWAVDLEKNFNVIPNKTHRLRPPNLHSDFLKCCYIVGYTDGDGCIHVNKKGFAHMHYVSASKDIINWIREFVDTSFNFKLRQRNNHVLSSADNAYHGCHIYGLQAVKFFELLRSISLPHFARKWDNPAFLQLCETYHQRFPKFFGPDFRLVFDQSGAIVFAKNLQKPSLSDITPPQNSVTAA